MQGNSIILLKFPTRERPNKAISIVKNYIDLAENNNKIIYLISVDENDNQTNNDEVITKFESLHENVICICGQSKNKIHAYNRDIEFIDNWDILIAASDDMVCVQKGWDNIIRKQMRKSYPNTDGVLHFNDGYVGSKLNTLPILGRKYYDRFGYVYHHSYFSLWCDNEQMEVATQLKKQTYFEQILFKHEHFSNNASVKRDALIRKTESFFYVDRRNYQLRKKRNFDINKLPK
jgi:hypothetical protein